MEIDPAQVAERLKGTLSDLFGMRIVEATPDRVVAKLGHPGRDPDRGPQPARRHADGPRRYDRRHRHRLEPAARRRHDHARVQDEFLRGRALGHRARGVDAASSGQAHSGLADARHRRERAPALAHHPDPDGPDVTRRGGGAASGAARLRRAPLAADSARKSSRSLPFCTLSPCGPGCAGRRRRCGRRGHLERGDAPPAVRDERRSR